MWKTASPQHVKRLKGFGSHGCHVRTWNFSDYGGLLWEGSRDELGLKNRHFLFSIHPHPIDTCTNTAALYITPLWPGKMDSCAPDVACNFQFISGSTKWNNQLREVWVKELSHFCLCQFYKKLTILPWMQHWLKRHLNYLYALIKIAYLSLLRCVFFGCVQSEGKFCDSLFEADVLRMEGRALNCFIPFTWNHSTNVR